jgi:simple sugar transport system permease protein
VSATVTPAAAPAVAPHPPRTAALRGVWRVLAAFLAALVGFAVLMLLKGVNPFTAYKDMVVSTFTDKFQLAGILVRATPIMLAGLAVAVPARAGLINVRAS